MLTTARTTPPNVAQLGPTSPSSARACPLCGGSDSDVHLCVNVTGGPAARTYELRSCRVCELIFLDPRLSDEVLSRLYDEEFYFSTRQGLSDIAAQVIHTIQCARQHRIQQYVRSGLLLDIGSGDGEFVAHMANRGWHATGIDFSPAAQALAERRGSPGRFLCGSIFDLELEPRSFDVVTMWQVLEHIGEPLEFLERTHQLLRRGGVFVASVPNIDSLSAVLTGERWWGLDVPRHLVHYSPRTLGTALTRSGFTIERIRHLSLQYDPYGLLHSTLDWVFTRRHFLSDLVKHQLPRDLGAGEYTYNVTALALLGPLLAPASVVTTMGAAAAGHGGFIEVVARRR